MRAAGVLLAATIAQACATTPMTERSAMLPASTAEARLAINAAMADMTGVPLRATTRSFRDSDTETLTWGGTGTGMDVSMPGDFRTFTFRLLDAGGTCQLLHVETGERRSLPDVGCQRL